MRGEVVTDGASIRHRPSKAIERRHHERVASSDKSEWLIGAGSGAGCASEPVVEVDPLVGDAEFGQMLVLSSEVLSVEQRA